MTDELYENVGGQNNSAGHGAIGTIGSEVDEYEGIERLYLGDEEKNPIKVVRAYE